MATLEGPVLCSSVAHLKITRVPTATAFAGNHFTKRGGSSFWGFTCNYRGIDSVSFGKSIWNSKRLSICCSSSSSDNNGNTAGNFSERDGDYVDCSVMEAGKFSFFPITWFQFRSRTISCKSIVQYMVIFRHFVHFIRPLTVISIQFLCWTQHLICHITGSKSDREVSKFCVFNFGFCVFCCISGSEEGIRECDNKNAWWSKSEVYI